MEELLEQKGRGGFDGWWKTCPKSEWSYFVWDESEYPELGRCFYPPSDAEDECDVSVTIRDTSIQAEEAVQRDDLFFGAEPVQQKKRPEVHTILTHTNCIPWAAIAVAYMGSDICRRWTFSKQENILVGLLNVSTPKRTLIVVQNQTTLNLMCQGSLCRYPLGPTGKSYQLSSCVIICRRVSSCVVMCCRG
jgi:hypothetical protein